MIATLDDVIEELADEVGVYGAHTEEHPDGQCECRVCWASDLRERILAAVEVDRKMESKSPFTEEQKVAIASAIFDNEYGEMRRLKAEGRWISSPPTT